MAQQRRKLLFSLSATTALTPWAKPIVTAVILPAHAVTSPPPTIYITTVTISDDIGGDPALRRVSFSGQAFADDIEYFYDAVLNVVISTDTDTVTFDITVGGYLSGIPSEFESQNIIISNSTFSNISIKVESQGVACDSVSVPNEAGISAPDILQHLSCPV